MKSPAYELTRCPTCGGADTAEIASREDMQRELEALWEFHTRRLRPDTPPEHLTDRLSFSQRLPLRLVQCARCGLIYRNPREREHELAEVYEGAAPAREVLQALFDTQRGTYKAQAARLMEVAGRAGSGLEVGSYVGGFLAAARELRWRFEGVDVNEEVNAFARAKGFRVTHGDIARVPGEQRFDSVAFWNCFDQLADPRTAAVHARRLISPGGVLAVRVPNGEFYAAVRRHLAGPLGAAARTVLAHNNLLSFPYRHGFGARSLGYLLERVGFTVVRVAGDTLVPIADDWTRRWAAAEERLVKGVLYGLARVPRGLSRARASAAPWIEVYCRPVGERQNGPMVAG